MERKELYHDRCMGFLPAECVRDVGAAKPNEGARWCGNWAYSRGVWATANCRFMLGEVM